MGFQNQQQLGRFYALADTLVFPSMQGETWGLVVNEAMACGLPVLCSETVGACYDLVRDGENGFRFDPGETSSIGRALTAMATSPDREAMGRRSLEIISEWTPEDFARNFWAAAEVSSGS
jgi:glycosyltransferase involved in cell wall biosynthesis